MRFLNSIKQPIYYAKYYGKTEIKKTVNNKELRTGDYQLSYGAVGVGNLYLSVPRKNKGQAEREANGVHTNYEHTIISETDLGLDVEDLMWVGVEEYDGGGMWTVVDSYDGGTIQPWSDGAIVNGGVIGDIRAYTVFQILEVEKSYHHVTYRVKEL